MHGSALILWGFDYSVSFLKMQRLVMMMPVRRQRFAKPLRVAFALTLMLCAPAAAQAPDPGCASTYSGLAELFVGITMQTVAFICPPSGGAATTAFAVRVDLKAPGLSFEASPQGSLGKGSFDLELTTTFLQKTNSQVAINANLFTVCCTVTPPTKPATELLGLEVDRDKVLSPLGHNPGNNPPYPFDASLIVAGKALRIVTLKQVNPIEPTVSTAVTGSHLLVSANLNVAPLDTDPVEFFGPNARTLVGLSAREDVLWIVAVERAATQGVTLPQAAQLMMQLGAATALNLDGGGSTSLALDAGGGKVRLVNTPNGDYTAGCTFPKDAKCERYVGASFGIHAQQLPSVSR
jgi:hypothetical protein